jgi:PKD repeat protein
MFKSSWYFIILIVLAACKRGEEPIEQIGTPVFSVSGTIDGAPVNLTAGINNYFLFTNFSSDKRDITLFSGTLGPQQCEGCAPSLSIDIRNYTAASTYTIDSVDHQPRYFFYNTQKDIEPYYQLSCQAQPVGTGTPIISWDFGNNRYSGETNPVAKFEQAGIYNVIGSAVFPSNCFSVLSQPIYLTPTRVGKHTNFTVNYPDTHTLLFNSLPVDASALVNWDFGDGQQATGTIVAHTYATRGLYKVRMQYQKGSDTMVFCKNVNTLDFTSCTHNFDFRTAFVVDSLHLSHVVVKWRDASGTLYSSAGVEQPDYSYFKITEASDYVANEKGNPTRKYTFETTCRAANGTKVIELKKVKGIFGYAYPK